jgi:hypothetical protein
MQKRKLQIFLSSTYEDLIDHRLAAMEAILAAGHIPAAMEQFSPGDETAWEKIKAWIDESDAFMLILGGRYGSIEPASGKSYVQLEYEYVVEKKKPFFAVVISPEHLEQRIKDIGLKADERQNPEKYKGFKNLVTQRLCAFWSDKKDIKSVIFQKLPEWAQRPDLKGWIRGDEVASPEVMNELARLSQENRELRAAGGSTETFASLRFDELRALLAQRYISAGEVKSVWEILRLDQRGREIPSFLELFQEVFANGLELTMLPNTGSYAYKTARSTLDELATLGLVEIATHLGQVGGSSYQSVRATEAGKRFRNRLLAQKKLGENQQK